MLKRTINVKKNKTVSEFSSFMRNYRSVTYPDLGELVGSSGQCAWKYTHNWGEQLVCGRSDEAVMGM